MSQKQVYSMIFWRYSEKDDVSFDNIARRIFKVLNVFKKHFPEKYQPNFCAVKNKSNAKLYDWNYNNFYDDLKRNVNQTKEMVFKELGYSLSFFSSLEDAESCGYMVHVGATSPNCLNTFAVNLSIDFDYFNKECYNILEKVFYKCVKEFKPFYACVYNSQINGGKFAKFKSDTVYDITNIHWLNYCSPEIINKFNKDTLKKLSRQNKEFVFKNGFIKLQKKPLDAENNKDIYYLKDVEQLLGLL